MVSSVFLMQPVGQALAQLVGVWVVLGRNTQYGLQELQCGINDKNETKCKEIIDGVWRIVIGSGAVPALLAIIFRFFLFDCGLYSLEVKKKPGMAFRDTQRVYGAPPTTSGNGVTLSSPGVGPIPSYQPSPIQFSIEDLRRYFIRDGNWLYLLGKPCCCGIHLVRARELTLPQQALLPRGSSSTSPFTASPSTTAACSPTSGPRPSRQP